MLAPSKAVTHLARDEALALPRPFLFLSTFDVALHQSKTVLKYSEMVSKSIEGPKGLVHLPESLMNIAKLAGRPVWSTKPDLKSAMNTAFEMLQDDASIFKISAFIMRMGASMNPQDPFSRRLVLTGLATLRYVDFNEFDCEVNYSVEPVVANVARVLIGSLDDLKVALEDYVRRLNRGVMHDLGVAGELVARILLMRVQDSLVEFSTIPPASEPLFFSHNLLNSPNRFPLVSVVKLSDFLKQLGDLTNDELASLNLSAPMLDGLVHLSQNFQMMRPVEVNQILLAHAFVRGVGFILPGKFEGIDLLVPVFRSDNTFSCLVIQVKNLSQLSILGPNSDQAQDIIRKLSAIHIPNFSLRAISSFKNVPGWEIAKVVIQFRPPFAEKDVPTKSIVDAQRSKVLWLLGLDAFEHLFGGPESAVIDLLNEILYGDRDFVKTIPTTLEPCLTSLQSTRDGVRTLLSSFSVLESSTYQYVHDCQFDRKTEAKNAKETLEKLGVDLTDIKADFEITVADEEAHTEYEAGTTAPTSPAAPDVAPSEVPNSDQSSPPPKRARTKRVSFNLQ